MSRSQKLICETCKLTNYCYRISDISDDKIIQWVIIPTKVNSDFSTLFSSRLFAFGPLIHANSHFLTACLFAVLLVWSCTKVSCTLQTPTEEACSVAVTSDISKATYQHFLINSQNTVLTRKMFQVIKRHDLGTESAAITSP